MRFISGKAYVSFYTTLPGKGVQNREQYIFEERRLCISLQTKPRAKINFRIIYQKYLVHSLSKFTQNTFIL